MKRLFFTFLTCLFLLMPPLSAMAAPPSDLVSGYAVLMDLDTGQVLYDKKMEERVYPASTTKVLTALVVLENSRPYEVVTVNQSAVEDIEWDNSHIALTEGEQFTVESGLYALMLPSANDAANALAEHVAGSQAAFVDMMNEKAKEIGAVNSNFANAHGLHDDDHYTTAYDMALITRYAMHNELFRDFFGTARYTMPATNKNSERPFTNYQYQLVRETGYYNPDVIGGKVGFTNQAQNTMTTVASRNGRSLVCVVMHSSSRGDKFDDTGKLLDFGFGEFVPYYAAREGYAGFQAPILEDGQAVGSVTFTAENDFRAWIHDSINPDSVSIRYEKPDIYLTDSPITCTVSFELQESPAFVPASLGTIQMSADIRLPDAVTAMASGIEPGEPAFLPKSLKLAGFAAGGLLIIFLLIIFIRQIRLRRRRKARLARLARRRYDAGSLISDGYRPPPSRVSRSGHIPRARAD